MAYIDQLRTMDTERLEQRIRMRKRAIEQAKDDIALHEAVILERRTKTAQDSAKKD